MIKVMLSIASVLCLWGVTSILTGGADWELFSTQEQKAQRLYDQGLFEESAALFTDPSHQGDAWWRVGDFEKAAAAYGRSGTPEGLFNRGNALVLLGQYTEAIELYDRVLRERVDWQPALENRRVAQLRMERLQASGDHDQPQQADATFEPDDVVFDANAQNSGESEPVEVDLAQLSDAALRKMWLRQVETRVSDFLQRKFAYQHARAREQREVGQ